jgi:hypothetical protein
VLLGQLQGRPRTAAVTLVYVSARQLQCMREAGGPRTAAVTLVLLYTIFKNKGVQCLLLKGKGDSEEESV